MPKRFCKHPLCAYFAMENGYCAQHQRLAVKRSQSEYDEKKRDKDGDKFYHSKNWKATRERHLHEHQVCEICGKLPFESDLQVHHITPRAVAPERALDPSNLQALCPECHNAIEHRRGK